MIKAIEGRNSTLYATEGDTPIRATSSSGALSPHKPFSQLAKIKPSEHMPFSATVNGAARLVFDSNLNRVHRISLRDQPNEVIEIDLSKIRGLGRLKHSAAAHARVIVDVLRNESGHGYTLRAKVDVANDIDDHSAHRYNPECKSFARYKVDTSSRTSRSIKDPHLNFIMSTNHKFRQLAINPPSKPSDDNDDEHMTITPYRIEQPSADDYILHYSERYGLKEVDDQVDDPIDIRRSSEQPPSYEDYLKISARGSDETTI